MKAACSPVKTVEKEEPVSALNPLCSRRQLLVWSGASAVGLSTLSPLLVFGADKPLIIMEHAKGLVVADPVLCVGCCRCELACTEFNDGKAAPALSRIKVDRNLNFGSQGVTTWRERHGNQGDGLIVQDLCKQCPHPVPCANICPENAIVLSPVTNARFIDQEKCTGCRVCLRGCPWELISFDPDSRKASKCHLCQGKPKCVQACPAGSLSYVSWRDLTDVIPPRNLNISRLSPQRAANCQGCHLPGQSKSIRQSLATIRSSLGGGRYASSDGTAFRWIDLAGAILIPLTIGSVLVHGLLRRVMKR